MSYKPRMRISSLIDPRTVRRQSRFEARDRGLSTEKSVPLSGIIKDELFLIGFLVLSIGIVFTDAYYARFGVKYQLLSLPTFHIVYRGLTALIDAPYLMLPYLLTMTWLVLDLQAIKRGWSRFISVRVLASYIVLFGVLALSYPLGVRAGVKLAEQDLRNTTSTLPRIARMLTDKEEFRLPTDNYRLLMIDADYVLIFKPLEPGDQATIPKIKRYSKGDVHVIETLP